MFNGNAGFPIELEMLVFRQVIEYGLIDAFNEPMIQGDSDAG